MKFWVVVDVAHLTTWTGAVKWWQDHEISLMSFYLLPFSARGLRLEVKGDHLKHWSTNGTIGYFNGGVGCLLCRRTAAAHGVAFTALCQLHTLITPFAFEVMRNGNPTFDSRS